MYMYICPCILSFIVFLISLKKCSRETCQVVTTCTCFTYIHTKVNPLHFHLLTSSPSSNYPCQVHVVTTCTCTHTYMCMYIMYSTCTCTCMLSSYGPCDLNVQGIEVQVHVPSTSCHLLTSASCARVQRQLHTSLVHVYSTYRKLWGLAVTRWP